MTRQPWANNNVMQRDTMTEEIKAAAAQRDLSVSVLVRLTVVGALRLGLLDRCIADGQAHVPPELAKRRGEVWLKGWEPTGSLIGHWTFGPWDLKRKAKATTKNFKDRSQGWFLIGPGCEAGHPVGVTVREAKINAQAFIRGYQEEMLNDHDDPDPA